MSTSRHSLVKLTLTERNLMTGLLRARKNHRKHTECSYGCCVNGDTNKKYRAREKRAVRLTILAERR